MAYDLETNASFLLSDLIDSKTGRAQSQGSVVTDLLAQADINLKQSAQFGADGYAGGSGFERVRFNNESVLSAEDQASNSAALATLGPTARFTGQNVRGSGTTPAYLNQIISSDGQVKAAAQQDYKKIKVGDQIFDAGVKSFLSAAFAGAAGFGPLAGGGTAFSSSIGSTLGQVGKSAVAGGIQGGVNSFISGGDLGKGIVKGAVGGGVSSTISPVFGNSLAGRAATGAVTSGVTAAVTGGDPLTAGILGAIGGANLGKLAGLDGAAATFVNQLASITAQSQLQQRKTKGG